MDYPNEPWIVAKTRETARWRDLSLGARSLHLEFTRALGRFTNEMSFGPKGLAQLGAFVNAQWAEIQPWLDELLADGWLEHDAQSRLLRDPKHLERQSRSSLEYYVKLYCRNTAGWLALSLRARGLSLELTRHMGRASDEIDISTTGLAGIAGVVNAPWTEVQPLLRELLRSGRLVHDKDRKVLRDPSHAARQSAQASSTQRVRDLRAKRNAVKRSATLGNVEHDACNDQKEEKEKETNSPPVVPLPGDTTLEGSTARRRTLAPDGDRDDPRVRAWAEKWKIDWRHSDFANWFHYCRAQGRRHVDWHEAWLAWLSSAHAPAAKVRASQPLSEGFSVRPAGVMR